MPEPLITKYRPTEFSEVIGHDETVASLQRAISSPSCPHAFLLTGPSGTGKTTLARIIGNHLQAEVLEVDAASNNGIDSIRTLIELGQHKSLYGVPSKMFILDECFAKGTQVFTPFGKKSIEDFIPGDLVYGAKGIQTVIQKSISYVELSRIVKLNLSDGKVILVSEDHSFLTDQGWRFAKDVVSRVQVPIHTNLQPYLLEMWDSIYYYQSRFQKLRRLQRNFSCTTGNSKYQKLSYMWNSIYRLGYLLFQKLWLQVRRTKAPRLSARNLETSSKRCTEKACSFTKRQRNSFSSFSKNDNKQSYEESRSYRKDESYQGKEWDTKSSQTLARRKWPWSFETTGNAISSGWGEDGVCIADSRFTQREQVSSCLQDRFSFSRGETSDRDRRWDTRNFRAEIIGREEGYSNQFAWVVSCSHLEQADIEKLRRDGQICSRNGEEFAIFYDLSVKEHPSFNVEGLIVHNCHALSRSSWQALLKLLEEPPDHLYLALCTTELQRVIDTVITRCYHVPLHRLRDSDIEILVALVCECEGWTPTGDITQLIVQSATGQPRKALSILQSCHDAPTREEASRIISLVEGTDLLRDLLNQLLSGKSWEVIRPILQRMDEEDFEEALIPAGRYIMGAMIKEESASRAGMMWNLLEALVYPSNTFDKKAMFVAAVGRMIWGS